MNKINIIFVLILISNFTFGQKKKNQEPSSKYMPPPNGIWIEKDSIGFWIDQTEAANIHWLEFLVDVYSESPEMYWRMYPDTTVLVNVPEIRNKEKHPHFPYIQHYLRYPGFRNNPVLGVSYEQVKEFCKWRSKVVTDAFNSSKKPKHLSNYYVEFVFRLPTEKEWEIAAQGDNTNQYGFSALNYKKRYIRKYYPKGSSRANTATAKHDARGTDTTFSMISITEYIFSYPPNDFGLYNMIGNVAEMVQEKGIAKGGSWLDELEGCAIKKRKIYDKANAWLGFRCVCDVKFTKINSE